MGERIRFYADEHAPSAVVKGLRLHGVDVLTTAEAGMLGASDKGQLAFATREGRVLYTQDADYLRLHQAGIAHAGIAYARQGRPVGEVVRGLLLVYDVLDAESVAGAVDRRGRVRVGVHANSPEGRPRHRYLPAPGRGTPPVCPSVVDAPPP